MAADQRYFTMSQFPEEPLASTAEGYYPIKVGQSLKDGHYKVLRKLGWGPRSTVWLASYPRSVLHCSSFLEQE
jgi:hypothetical protein